VVALAASVMQVPAFVAAQSAQAEESPAEAVTETQASALARKTGKPVNVTSMQNETRDIVANSDGTFTLTQHLRPVRTRKSGAWVKIDTTLKRQPNGAIAPIATSAGLTFSGGGDGPMVTMSRAGRQLSLSWPGKLPEPTLSGDTATFADVLPDVDLILRAKGDGFAHLLKVKTPEAARNPKLAKLRFKLDAPGLSIQPDAAGTLEAMDTGSGGGVFEAPAPLMWDSADRAGAKAAGGKAKSAGQDDAVKGPAEHSKTARLNVGIGQGELTLEPDQGLLAAPDTNYPVFIDPQWEAKTAAAWTMVSSGFPTTTYYKFNGNDDEGDGLCDVSVSVKCNVTQIKRLFYRMPLSGVAGQYVESVEFDAFETDAFNCSTDTSVELWHASGFSSSSTWNTTSDNWKSELTSRSVSYCSKTPVEFGGSNLASVVRAAANNKDSAITFGLRAGSESSMTWWKRFADDAALKVQYNRPPKQPDTKTMYANPGTPCVDKPDAKWVNDEPTVFATLVDPDTEDAAKIQGQFQVSWDDGTGWGPKWTAPLTAPKASGGEFSVKIPDGVLPKNTLMDWHVRAWDGTQWGPWSWTGAATGCYFYFDSTVPAPPTVTSTDYPADGNWYDGVGRPGVFTVDDPSNAATRYDVSLNAVLVKSVPTSAGAPAQVTLTPTRSGENMVTVQSFTTAGTPSSSPTTYKFDVKAGADPVAHWKLDEPAGQTQLTGSSAQDIAADLNGGVTLGSAGKVGQAMTLDRTGYAATSGPVVHTDQSFTVSSWVKLDRTDLTRTFLSQEGSSEAGFYFGYEVTANRWAFRMRAADVSGAAWIYALSDSPPGVNVWTHLVGVYDASADQMRLYVDGVQQQAVTQNASPWDAGGSLIVGRGKYQGNPSSYWSGAIDDVRVFQKPLTAGDAAGLYENRPIAPAEIAHWALDEPVGASQVTGKANTRLANANGNVTLGVEGQVGTAAEFDGSTGYAATDGPVIDTSKSFSVSAWVKLAPGAETQNMSVLSQDGNRQSGFSLKYYPTTQKWQLLRYVSDDDTAANKAATSLTSADLGYWTHLVGVFDAQEQKLKIYMNGNHGVDGDFTTPWNATGGLEIGRSKSSGSERNYFDGEIDDVRVYDRIVTADEAKELYNLRPVLKGRWKLNTDGADDSGNGHAMTFGGTAHVDPSAGFYWGMSPGGLVLNGSSDYAQTAAPVLDTSQSFTVTAWVQGSYRPTAKATVFSQAGANTNRFLLRYLPGADPATQGSYELEMADSDVVSPRLSTTTHAGFTEGGWDQLAIVYDAAADKMSLYVNGALEENGSNVSEEGQVLAFNATNGGLQLGRSKLGVAEYWPGLIDDVWAYQGALSEEQILLLAAPRELETENGP
jgi:hypothetical protein